MPRPKSEKISRRVLVLIPELLNLVLAHLDRSDCAKLVSVSRLWFYCIAPLLWHNVTGLTRLFSLISGARVTLKKKGGVDRTERIVIFKQVIDIPRRADFSRFELYAEFVKNLDTSDIYKFQGKKEVNTYRNSRKWSLLPNLISLKCQYRRFTTPLAMLDWIKWFVGPSLLRLYVMRDTPSFWGSTPSINAKDKFVYGLLEVVAPICPNLQLVEVPSCDPVQPQNFGDSIISKTSLASQLSLLLPTLREISGTESFLEPQSLEFLSKLPLLEVLRINAQYCEPSSIATREIKWPENCFSAIRQLHLVAVRLDTLESLWSFNSLINSLIALEIETGTQGRSTIPCTSAMGRLTKFIRELASRSPYIDNLNCRLHACSFFCNACAPARLSLPELESLSLLPLTRLSLQRIWLAESISHLNFAQAIPQVRTLRLPDILVTLEDLSHYAAHLPHLSYFHFTLYDSSLAGKPMIAKVPVKLVSGPQSIRLDVRIQQLAPPGSRLHEDQISTLARYFHQLWPRACCFSANSKLEEHALNNHGAKKIHVILSYDSPRCRLVTQHNNRDCQLIQFKLTLNTSRLKLMDNVDLVPVVDLRIRLAKDQAPVQAPLETNLPFSAESLRKDLTQGIDRPLYPLSSYGPSKSIPCIIDGLDQSPEELRVAAWTANRDAGGIEKAHEKQLIDAAQLFIGSAASTGAITLDEAKRIWNLVDEHGNPPANGQAEIKSKLRERLQSSTPSPAFGINTAPTPTFGSSAFGSSQPAQTSAFGSSGFVKPGTGAFGSSTGSAAFGGGTTNAFGGSSQSQPSAFGGTASQPSAFGAPAQTTGSAFGSSTGGTTFGQSGFGAKPAFGQSGFGSSTTPSTTLAFGSSAPTSAFGQSGFGTSATATTTTTAAPAFGQSGFGSKPAGSAFGSSTGGGGAFGAFANKSSSFGGTNTGNTTSAFGAPAGGTSAFGSGSSSTTPAFGSSGFGAFANKSTSFGAQPSTGSAFGSSTTSAGTGGLFIQTNTSNNNNGAEGMDSDTPTTTQAPASAFGQPASSTTSAFGQTQQPSTSSAFGQTQPTSAFGSSAFGAKSAFGTTPGTTSAFGTAPSTTSAFGNTSSTSTSAFGTTGATSAFGTTTKPSAFGATSAFGSSSGTAFNTAKPKDRDPFAALLPDDYMNTLSEGIINAFKADKFELGSIPECVPPLEMR
ncbi:F-box-like domain-containing protein [Rhizoctonia solani AG-1 IA]|uniref:F-box-like domain-containing protein n=1 Tax=Thanatephorus cucumeris (strain AG1-IA) TaxID=983506 RepID=L8WZP0_THACA|nr:F-box-like domain-containing protein [Rhizoctonia solani AG-1 IA]